MCLCVSILRPTSTESYEQDISVKEHSKIHTVLLVNGKIVKGHHAAELSLQKKDITEHFE